MLVLTGLQEERLILLLEGKGGQWNLKLAEYFKILKGCNISNFLYMLLIYTGVYQNPISERISRGTSLWRTAVDRTSVFLDQKLPSLGLKHALVKGSDCMAERGTDHTKGYSFPGAGGLGPHLS